MEKGAGTTAQWTLDDLPVRVGPPPRKVDRNVVLAQVLADFDERVEQVRITEELPRRIEAVFLRGAAAVDRARLARFQGELRDLGDTIFHKTGGQYNYLDIARYLAIKSRHVVELGLDRGPPLRIFDLATGGGHFPFLARQYGHDVGGIDMDVPTYTRILDLYGIDRIARPIVRLEKMPVSGPYDVITGLAPMFNRSYGDRSNRFWTVDEWIWFVEYLCELLRYPGRIYFSLNRYFVQRRDMTDDLLDLFEANGAHVEFSHRTVLFKLEKPIKLRK
jgi:hypothetical protein